MTDDPIDPTLEALDKIRQSFGGVADAIKDMEPDVRQLGTRGWTVPMWAIPATIPLLARLASEAETDDYFVRAYSKDGGVEFDNVLQEITRHRETQRWRDLHLQAAQAYERGHHSVVVPGLLTSLEGLLASVTDQFLENHAPTKLVKAEQDLAFGSMEALVWISIESFVAATFKGHGYSGKRRRVLNRHWILHGRDAPNWTQADSLRLFQAIHTVANARIRRRKDPHDMFYDSSLYDELIRRFPDIGAPWGSDYKG